GGPVPYFDDAGGSSSRRLSPTRGIRPRTPKRYWYRSQLLFIPILTRFGAAARFLNPRRSPSKPVRPLVQRLSARSMSRLAERSAASSRLSWSFLPLH